MKKGNYRWKYIAVLIITFFIIYQFFTSKWIERSYFVSLVGYKHIWSNNLDISSSSAYKYYMYVLEFRNAYKVILEEIERIWKDKTYIAEYWKNVDIELGSSIYFPPFNNYSLGYILYDLSGDGKCELIIGEQDQNKEYQPIAIYKYTEEGKFIEVVIRTNREKLIIYQNGTYRLTGGYSRFLNYSYYKLQKYPNIKKYLGTLSEEENAKGVLHYYWEDGGVEVSNEIQLTKQEYLDKIKEFTIEKLNPEWQLLHGFWKQQEEISEQELVIENCYVDETEAYRNILEEYAFALTNINESYKCSQCKYVCYSLLYEAISGKTLYYSIKDLDDNGYPELIMGTLQKNGSCAPYVIYHYSPKKGIIYNDLAEGLTTSLYEDGIIAQSGSGILKLYRFSSTDAGKLEYLAYYNIREIEKHIKKYKKNIGDEETIIMEETSEKEYRAMIEKYTSKPINLEWLTFDTFFK